MKDDKFQHGKAIIRQLVQQHPGCDYTLLKTTVMTQLKCSQTLVSRVIVHWKCLGHLEVQGKQRHFRYFWNEEPKSLEEILWEDAGISRKIVRHVGKPVDGKPLCAMEWAVQQLEAA